jgi:hypothetical protein
LEKNLKLVRMLKAMSMAVSQTLDENFDNVTFALMIYPNTEGPGLCSMASNIEPVDLVAALKLASKTLQEQTDTDMQIPQSELIH